MKKSGVLRPDFWFRYHNRTTNGPACEKAADCFMQVCQNHTFGVKCYGKIQSYGT
jgi:hypothetical protein